MQEFHFALFLSWRHCRTIIIEPKKSISFPKHWSHFKPAVQACMVRRPSQIVVTPLPKAIDHYFGLALYLLVLTGFGTLAATGGLDLPSIIVVGAALAIRGYLLAKRRKFAISERWTTPLSIAYFVFFGIDYIAFSRASYRS